MKQNTLFTFALLLSAAIPTSALAEDVCGFLDHKGLRITANGHEGDAAYVSPGLSLSKAADGTYTFQSVIFFKGEKGDKIIGKCKDRHITFKRIREGGFEQDYDGWLFEGGSAETLRGMAGTFAHNGVEQWSWYGQTIPTIPK
ncbi:hypothetical protein V2P20_02325 [Methylobacter sp. Wu1]|uniref:hypothetical protein n=1 Tax=Methylobacter sp. Wu1 TaxID=3119359 RepID=UPI002F93070B